MFSFLHIGNPAFLCIYLRLVFEAVPSAVPSAGSNFTMRAYQTGALMRNTGDCLLMSFVLGFLQDIKLNSKPKESREALKFFENNNIILTLMMSC